MFIATEKYSRHWGLGFIKAQKGLLGNLSDALVTTCAGVDYSLSSRKQTMSDGYKANSILPYRVACKVRGSKAEWACARTAWAHCL